MGGRSGSMIWLLAAAMAAGCDESGADGPSDAARDAAIGASLDAGRDAGTDAEVDAAAVEMYCPEHANCTEPFCDQVLVPGGEFLMGANHEVHTDTYWLNGLESPVHRVRVDPFCIDEYEVTIERYEHCVDEGECSPEGLLWVQESYETVVNHYPPECDDREQCPEFAVNAKNYRQAGEYCAWIGGHLCTEAQWERAANGPGPEQRVHPWGDDPPTSELANIPSVGSGYIDPVDSHPAGASVEGVLNLAGNVYEWVEDAYEFYPVTADGDAIDNPRNPPRSEQQMVIGRGSCFFTEPIHTVSERTVFPQDFDWG